MSTPRMSISEQRGWPRSSKNSSKLFNTTAQNIGVQINSYDLGLVDAPWSRRNLISSLVPYAAPRCNEVHPFLDCVLKQEKSFELGISRSSPELWLEVSAWNRWKTGVTPDPLICSRSAFLLINIRAISTRRQRNAACNSPLWLLGFFISLVTAKLALAISQKAL